MEIQHNMSKVETFQGSYWQSTLSDALPSVTMGTYDIVPMTVKDSEKMLDFLRTFFFKDEPLNVAVGLLTSDNDRCMELEEYCVSSIEDGLSLMAVSDSGNLIGVSLNGAHEPGHLEEMERDADDCPNPKFRKIMQLLANVERRAEVFTKYPDVDRMVEVRIISVDDRWRGRGVATALLDRTRVIAKQRGYPLIRVDCSSHYSALAVARLGFECIFTMRYEDYKREGSTEPVFRPALPHCDVTTYVQRVQQ